MPWGSMMHLLLNFNLLFMFQSQKMLEEKQARKKEKEVEKMEKEKRLQKLKSQVLILQFSSIYKTRRFTSYFASVVYCQEQIKHFFSGQNVIYKLLTWTPKNSGLIAFVVLPLD